MAIPFTSERSPEEQVLLDIYLCIENALRSRSARHPSRNHRAPRQHVGIPQPVVIWLPSGNVEELSSVPLPDLVQSTMEQLPPPSPQVTASVPSSPMRDATFQFPECSVNGNIVPLPSPRPLPRRRLASEGSSLRTLRSETRQNEGNTSNTCCCYPSQNERQSWTNMGTNLRNIAGDFHACKTKDAESEKSRLSVNGRRLTNGNSNSTTDMLSLLIPTPLRETLWATVALYVGWKLVSRLR
ncbi:uncharacterized protein LOC109852992 [Pseudomyrmex gracilis]|uniref:uncharacterized protein LOC109852992 n=1 Tax=Pseudomyrmex gracilis TaxID=219809 RepID=UPI000994E082|nr:uncharacterized protein LOC109852992 [Pseudomyrmex gracilis]